jgi:hypothetical protein
VVVVVPSAPARVDVQVAARQHGRNLAQRGRGRPAVAAAGGRGPVGVPALAGAGAGEPVTGRPYRARAGGGSVVQWRPRRRRPAGLPRIWPTRSFAVPAYRSHDTSSRHPQIPLRLGYRYLNPSSLSHDLQSDLRPDCNEEA